MTNLPWPEPEAPPVSRKSIWPKVVAAGVVLSLLGVAGWWLYPMFKVIVCRSPGRTQAQSLEQAILSFADEYEGRWPFGNGSGADTLLESSPDNDLIRILSGKQPDENPRHIDFLGDTKQAKSLGRDGRMRGGLVWENDWWSLVDA